MTKELLSEEVVEKLKKNPYVKSVSSKGITYTLEFRKLFIERHLAGEHEVEIFESNGFMENEIGRKRIHSAKHSWVRKYNETGILGLNDDRAYHSGRPKKIEDTGDIIRKQAAQIKMLEEQLELVKKLDKSERRVLEKQGRLPKNKLFELIKKVINENKLEKMVAYLCKLGGVSTSGYYGYFKNEKHRNEKDKKDEEDFAWIMQAYDYKGRPKGSRTIQMTLQSVFNVHFNRKKILRLMKKFNLICKVRKPNPYKNMAKATQEHSVVPDRVKRYFKQDIPWKIILTDITYLYKIKDKWFYLSAAKDASTGEIVAFYVSDNLRMPLVLETVNQLISKNMLRHDTIIHSDQGVHYTSPQYQNLLKENNITPSMSRRGNCWDNAPMESFFGHMKDEIDFSNCHDLSDIEKMISEYIEYYNYHRYQWNLKKMTPIQYRNHLLAS